VTADINQHAKDEQPPQPALKENHRQYHHAEKVKIDAALHPAVEKPHAVQNQIQLQDSP
jgi:hypothetical protein